MSLNKGINVFLLILGLILIFYGSGISFLVNGIAKALIVLGVLFLLMGVSKVIFYKYSYIKSMDILNKVMNFFITTFLIIFIVIESVIGVYGFKKDVSKSDYIIVLGAGLWGDTPSDTLIRRLEGALKLSKINPDVPIIVSGGKGKGETITEAEAMSRYLISKGVSKESIIKEEKSTSTFENIKFSKEIIDKINKDNKTQKVTIVTSNFHSFRAKLMASRFQLTSKTYSTSMKKVIEPAYYIREFFAFIKSFIFDRA